jgi:hypothetical protein
MRALRIALGLTLSLAGWLGCSSQPPVTPADEEEAGPDIGIVNATVIVGQCPDAKSMNSRSANAAIQKLVAPCNKVPGGAAHFSATLVPGGRIKLASPSGDPAEGVVPTCVLSNQLTHRVLLRKECKFDVKLEERKLSSEPATPETTPPSGATP